MSSSRYQVIGLAGQIGSGKSSVGQGVASALECPLASFGDHVRRVASQRGLDHTREILQAVGEELINTLAAEEFVARVVADSGWVRTSGLVIEGIRHPHIAECVSTYVRPAAYSLIFLDAPRELRELRVRERDSISPTELSGIEKHSTERDVATRIRELADHVVPATADVQAAVSEVLKVLVDRR